MPPADRDVPLTDGARDRFDPADDAVTLPEPGDTPLSEDGALAEGAPEAPAYDPAVPTTDADDTPRAEDGWSAAGGPIDEDARRDDAPVSGLDRGDPPPDLTDPERLPDTPPGAQDGFVLPGSGEDRRVEPDDEGAPSAYGAPPPPAPVKEPRIAAGPGFLTLLLGGVIAGIIGFALSESDVFDRGRESPLTGLETRLGEQRSALDEVRAQAAAAADAASEARAAADAAAEAAAAAGDAAAGAASQDDLAALRDQIAALPTGPDNSAAPAAGEAAPSQGNAAPSVGTAAPAAPDTGLIDRLAALETELAALSDQVTALPEPVTAEDLAPLDDRLEALDGQLATLDEQVAALRTQVEGQQTAIASATEAADAARSSAADETRRISVQAALARIGAAIENGDGFVDATSALDTAGGIEVPSGLRDAAPEGVATLAALQADYPPLARRALGVSVRETAGGGVMDRFGAFLRNQTGARSLNAREGDDPDAILSRGEAALRRGDLAQALEELEALPEAGQEVMAPWTARARARLAALSALDDVAAATKSN